MSATFKTAGGSTVTIAKTTCDTLLDGIVEGTQTWEGSETDLVSVRPPVGTQITHAIFGGKNLQVTKTSLETAARGPICRLTLTLSNRNSNTDLPNDAAYELAWEKINRDMRTNPDFASGGAYSLTEDEIKQVDDKLAGVWIAVLSASQMELYNRLVRGQRTYEINCPVARVRKTVLTKPVAIQTNVQTAPPAQCSAPTTSAAGKTYTYVLRRNDISRTANGWLIVAEYVGYDDPSMLAGTVAS